MLSRKNQNLKGLEQLFKWIEKRQSLEKDHLQNVQATSKVTKDYRRSEVTSKVN